MPSSEGSELGPSGATPPGVRLTSVVLGVQAVPEEMLEARHVFRRKILLKPVVGFARRLVELDAKATKRPSLEIAASALAPSAGVTPSGVETRFVAGTQVLPLAEIVVTQVERSKISAALLGLGAVAPRLLAEEANATKSPSLAIAGLELAPVPGVVPSAVETRYVVGIHPVEEVEADDKLHVSRM